MRQETVFDSLYVSRGLSAFIYNYTFSFDPVDSEPKYVLYGAVRTKLSRSRPK